MTHFVGLDVSQRMTAICAVDKDGRRIWRGQCPSAPEAISVALRRHARVDAKIGIETGAMTPWLAHEPRDLGFDVVCLDARHARAALKMRINKTDQNDAEGLAQIVRTGWYRSIHVKSFDSHRARAILGARTQLVGMTTRLSNHIRGVLKTFGLLPGAMRGLPFDRKVEVLLEGRSDVALIIKAHARRLAATARAGRGFRPARGAHPTVGSIRAVEGVNWPRRTSGDYLALSSLRRSR
jgi:transposase